MGHRTDDKSSSETCVAEVRSVEVRRSNRQYRIKGFSARAGRPAQARRRRGAMMRIPPPATHVGKLVLGVAMCALLLGAARARAGRWTALEILPPHVRLQPGEAVH